MPKLSAKEGHLFSFWSAYLVHFQETLPGASEEVHMNLVVKKYKESSMMTQKVQDILDLVNKTPGYLYVILCLCKMPIWHTLGISHINLITRRGRQIVSSFIK